MLFHGPKNSPTRPVFKYVLSEIPCGFIQSRMCYHNLGFHRNRAVPTSILTSIKDRNHVGS